MATPRDTIPDLAGIDRPGGQALVDEVLASAPAGRWLGSDEAVRLLQSYGLPAPGAVVVRSARQAAAAGRSLGYPVVAKVADPDVVHKTDRGLVAVGIASGTDLTRTYRRFGVILDEPRPAVLVQRQVERGVELALGVVHDSTFGPLVMVAGGVTTDVLDDRAFVLPPVTAKDARRAVAGLRMAPLLRGFRGAPAVDLAAVEDLLMLVGRLAADLPEIAELDLNPVMATPTGVSCVDTKIRVQPYDRVDDFARPAMRTPG